MHQRYVYILAIIVLTASTLFTAITNQQYQSPDGIKTLEILSDPERNRVRDQYADFQPAGFDATIRQNCQIVIIIGLEGGLHIDDFASVLTKMAPGKPIRWRSQNAFGATLMPSKRNRKTLRRAIFNAHGRPSPEQVIKTISEICPNDGHKRIYIDGKSWPNGLRNSDRAWKSMTPLEISMSVSAMNEPTNLYDLMEAYSPYAEIKFIVLHRPYLSTVAAHKRYRVRTFYGGVIDHSNVVRGHMLMLREFLDTYMHDDKTGSRLWTVLCTEQIVSINHANDHHLKDARRIAISQISDFLGWPQGECKKCFDDWRENAEDPVKMLGTRNVEILFEHKLSLAGVWPPVDESVLATFGPQQKCQL